MKKSFISLEFGRQAFGADPAQTVALYATYSNINVRADREGVLDELGRIASTQFNGRVTRNMITSLYIARRRT